MTAGTIRRWGATVALVLGSGAGAAAIASAASGGSSSAKSGAPAFVADSAPSAQAPKNPADRSHGPGETLLTGSTAAKVRQAALAAVPGATVIRVETDSGSAVYEAHLQKRDGSYVTVLFDTNFKVTGTEPGFGGPRAGRAPDDGGLEKCSAFFTYASRRLT
jgi:hypothetical protein